MFSTKSESKALQPVVKMDTHGTQLTPHLLFVVLSATFGCWFGLGYSITCTNTPQNVIVQWIRSVKCHRLGDFRNSSTNFTQDNIWCKSIPEGHEGQALAENSELNIIWGVIGASISIGGFLSGWFSNALVAKFGNRNTILWTNIFGLVGSILSGICVITDSYEIFITSRLLLGMHCGFSLAVVPAYIAEISPSGLRGALGVIPGLMAVIGSLVSIVLGMPQVLGTVDLWPYIFWLRVIPVLTLFATLPFCPESPRYHLLIRKDKNEAKKALVWLRGTEDISDELKIIQTEEENLSSEKIISVTGLFSDPFLRKITFINIVLLMSQQLSGNIGIALYSTAIFMNAGLDAQLALYGSLVLFIVQIVALLLAMVLVDRVGRRVLLFVGNLGVVLSLLAMTTFMTLTKSGSCAVCRYGSLVALISFMLIFNIGPAMLPWILVSEMYSQTARGAAMMVAAGACQATAVLMAFIFPILQVYIDQWSFAIFAAIFLACTVYLSMKLIETKGKELGAIQTELRRKLM